MAIAVYTIRELIASAGVAADVGHINTKSEV
jgi:hypothetical protein